MGEAAELIGMNREPVFTPPKWRDVLTAMGKKSEA